MKATDLRGILTYVPRFRERTFVIALDGEIVALENFPNILLDIAVLRSLSIRIIIVHGAAWQIKELGEQTGVKISNSDGTGVTDAETLKVALTAANRITHEIMEGLVSNDLRACYSTCITAHPFGIIGGVDHQHTGRVEKIDMELLNQLSEKDIVPVLPPLGLDGDGHTFRVNSDAVALEVAKAVKAVKLIYVTTNGEMKRGGKVVSQMSVFEAEEYYRRHRSEIPPELVSKVEHATKAVREGVPRVHIIDGRQDEALLTEVFSNEGVGTMIYANEYQAIRRALKKDVRNIMSLIKPSIVNEELVKRSRPSILAQLSDYYVFEIDRNIVGCVALHPFPEQKKAELACLHVSGNNENQGIGNKLMLFAENTARDKGFHELFALSTHAFNYLQQKGGYHEGTPDDLPPSRREKYDSSGRNSKVLIKTLQSNGNGSKK
ncbi:MAG: amino-acid N-acetyltransferase [Candidatus Methylacidiphilales bacterium]|nr:amino-acid N-acetyltransferase [Candidatus Methylacidiphilales bacterium]